MHVGRCMRARGNSKGLFLGGFVACFFSLALIHACVLLRCPELNMQDFSKNPKNGVYQHPSLSELIDQYICKKNSLFF